MKPWHRGLGITPKGVKLADSTLPLAMALLQHVKDHGSDYEFVERILREAQVRVFTFDERDPKWVKKYLRENQ